MTSAFYYAKEVNYRTPVATLSLPNAGTCGYTIHFLTKFQVPEFCITTKTILFGKLATLGWKLSGARSGQG